MATLPSATRLVAMSRIIGGPSAGTPIAIGFVCRLATDPGPAAITNGGSEPPRSTIPTVPCPTARSAHAPARPGMTTANDRAGADPDARARRPTPRRRRPRGPRTRDRPRRRRRRAPRGRSTTLGTASSLCPSVPASSQYRGTRRRPWLGCPASSASIRYLAMQLAFRLVAPAPVRRAPRAGRLAGARMSKPSGMWFVAIRCAAATRERP